MKAMEFSSKNKITGKGSTLDLHSGSISSEPWPDYLL
jgi:hypothetical protein